MEKRPFVTSFLLLIFGLIFFGLFRTNLTGNIVADTKGEAAYQGFVSGIYLYLGLSFVLFAVVVFIYFNYKEKINFWFSGKKKVELEVGEDI
jgi:hypothetical protein